MNLIETASNINDLIQKSHQLYREGISAIEGAIATDKEAGLLLIKVKESLPHGEFTKWVETNCKFTVRHAQFLMKIAKEWDRIIAAWEKMKNETRFVFDSPLPSLRMALALAATEPKQEAPPPPPITTYKIANPQHPQYGEQVEEVKQINNGDIIVCKTPTGEFPFLKHELAAAVEPLKVVETEVIDVEIEDNSEKLREAIALIIEYLPETQLQNLLAQAVTIGREFLPDEAKQLIGQEMLILEGASS
ncbi:DUF3102 domain-containing protein [Anabaena sp. CCY 9910]|uniref:DUF3102 domain-containing protein n=1 Tax=Anabaena sp. CCY 9910 TaxID=3103870 RepID=UPI0039E00333